MKTADNKADPRFNDLRQWLASLGGFDLESLRPASGDASFRRYFRVDSVRTTHVVMDAPPGKEDCRPFVRIAGYLQDMGLHGPRVERATIEQGFLLLSDLGSRQYLTELQAHAGRAEQLYGDAMQALATMQLKGTAFQRELPPYDEKLLRFELSLFSDWLCDRYLAVGFKGDEVREWHDGCDLLVASALAQPRVFVHRDYHSRNLMLLPENNPGILDFQDAVEGPLTYDLVSLLKDCYIQWPAERIQNWALGFRSMTPTALSLTSDAFMRSFELMGVQRQLKAAGIFARLYLRDGKSSYLGDIPRTLNYILEIAPRYPELGFLAGIIRERVLPALQDRPA
jgi:aminoglycoside/choline kinase family phosphotransferase